MKGERGNNASLVEKYDRIRWTNGQTFFQRWTHGTTGFPLVDAGMRQLNHTGFMHNRLRMLTASFLVKDLHMDWRLGERYFATKLVDYYPSANSGGWQWASGGGADSQQYNRIFSPWLQAKKHDPQCVYIKRWVPELHDLPADVILNWDRHHHDYTARVDYPAPMIDHAEAARTFKTKVAHAIYDK